MIITSVNRGEVEYPNQLLELEDAPEKLYCRGDRSLLHTTCVAIVGSRKCSPYGIHVARAFARRLAEHGITIVSGMAIGIDTAAHQGAMEAGGRTIAVLGCGVDQCYPRESRGLMQQIAENHLVISEYDCGVSARRFHFPARNRIISGLSMAVVLVEAAYRSGSLITAEHAADQGRLLYAVPGNITSPSSVGSNQLIKDGVEPLLTPEDLLRDLKITPKSGGLQKEALGEEEEKIFSLLREKGELSTNQICKITYLSPKTINGIITVLEMKGFVETSMGRVFVTKIE